MRLETHRLTKAQEDVVAWNGNMPEEVADETTQKYEDDATYDEMEQNI